MDAFDTLIIVVLVFAVLVPGYAKLAQGQLEARYRLTRMEEKLNLLMTHQGLELAGPDLTEVHALVSAGRTVKAVKAYRKATGADLQTAADAVKRISRDQAFGA